MATSSGEAIEQMLADLDLDIDAGPRVCKIRMGGSGGVWTKEWLGGLSSAEYRLRGAGYTVKRAGGGTSACVLLVEYTA